MYRCVVVSSLWPASSSIARAGASRDASKTCVAERARPSSGGSRVGPHELYTCMTERRDSLQRDRLWQWKRDFDSSSANLQFGIWRHWEKKYGQYLTTDLILSLPNGEPHQWHCALASFNSSVRNSERCSTIQRRASMLDGARPAESHCWAAGCSGLRRAATRWADVRSTRLTSSKRVSGRLLKSISRCSNSLPRVASSTTNRTSCSAALR